MKSNYTNNKKRLGNVVNVHKKASIGSKQEHRIILTSSGVIEKWLYYKEGDEWVPGLPVGFSREDIKFLRETPEDELFSPEEVSIIPQKKEELVVGEGCWVHIKSGTWKKAKIIKVYEDDSGITLYNLRFLGAKKLRFLLRVNRGSISKNKPKKIPKRIKHKYLGRRAKVLQWHDANNVVIVKLEGSDKTSPYGIRNKEGEDMWTVLE